MIPIKNEAISSDIEGLKKAEQILSEILHEKAASLKENKEIWKSLVTFRSWLKKGQAGDKAATLQILSYGKKLLSDTAAEIHARAEDEQRIQGESPALPHKSVRSKSDDYIEAYNKLMQLHEWLKKRNLIGAPESIPVAV